MAVWACNDHQQMLSQLEELERQNLADSLMTNDSLALSLFDNHGTPQRAYACPLYAPMSILQLLDKSPQFLYSRRKKLHKDLFDTNGKPEEFDLKILKIK